MARRGGSRLLAMALLAGASYVLAPVTESFVVPQPRGASGDPAPALAQGIRHEARNPDVFAASGNQSAIQKFTALKVSPVGKILEKILNSFVVPQPRGASGGPAPALAQGMKCEARNPDVLAASGKQSAIWKFTVLKVSQVGKKLENIWNSVVVPQPRGASGGAAPALAQGIKSEARDPDTFAASGKQSAIQKFTALKVIQVGKILETIRNSFIVSQPRGASGGPAPALTQGIKYKAILNTKTVQGLQRPAAITPEIVEPSPIIPEIVQRSQIEVVREFHKTFRLALVLILIYGVIMVTLPLVSQLVANHHEHAMFKLKGERLQQYLLTLPNVALGLCEAGLRFLIELKKLPLEYNIQWWQQVTGGVTTMAALLWKSGRALHLCK